MNQMFFAIKYVKIRVYFSSHGCLIIREAKKIFEPRQSHFSQIMLSFYKSSLAH
jgi:hypothetical protein